MKKRRLFISILLIIVGIVMTFYSFIVNSINDRHNSTILNSYDKKVEEMEQSDIDKLIAKAQSYNESLVKTDVVITDPFDPDNSHRFLLKEYESMLNVGNDLLCYVEIPCINVYLPVYHGTSDVPDTLRGHRFPSVVRAPIL